MTKFHTYLLASVLTFPAGLMSAQTQNPDQQQEKTPDKGSTKSHRPQTEVVPPNSGPSPDTQQQQNGTTNADKHAKKNKNNARQAHGTPQPQSTKNPQP